MFDEVEVGVWSAKRRLRELRVWEEEHEATAFVAQGNGSGSGLANPLLRGATTR